MSRTLTPRPFTLASPLVGLLLTLFGLAGCGGGESSAGPASPPASTESSSGSAEGSPAPSEAPAEGLEFTPGGYGPLRAGMTAEEALATGLVERRAEPGCTGTIWMAPAYDDIYLDFNDDGDRVFLIGSYTRGPVTDSGVGVGSTVAELKRAYGAKLSAPELNDYLQWAFTVQRGGRYLTFLLPSDDGAALENSAVVSAVLASEGSAVTIYEGEGPC